MMQRKYMIALVILSIFIPQASALCNATFNVDHDQKMIYMSGPNKWIDLPCINQTIDNSSIFQNNRLNDWTTFYSLYINGSSTTTFYSNQTNTTLRLNGTSYLRYGGKNTVIEMVELNITSWDNITKTAVPLNQQRGYVRIHPDDYGCCYTLNLTNSSFNDLGYNGGWYTKGVTISSLHNGMINNTEFNGGYYNLFILDSDNVTFSGGSFHDGLHGLILADSTSHLSDIILRNLSVYNNTGWGVYGDGITTRVTITNASIYSNMYYGLKMLGANHVIINNSLLYNNSNLAHVGSWNQSVYFRNGYSILVENNTFNAAPAAKGVEYGIVNDSIIRNNTFYSQYWAAIYTSEESYNISVLNNTIYDTKADVGIVIVNTNNSLVQYNYINGSYMDGLIIEDVSNNNTIDSNILSNNSWGGIALLNTVYTELQVNNSITNNIINTSVIGHGIVLRGAINSNISYNIIDSNSYGAYEISAVAANNSIHDNTIINSSDPQNGKYTIMVRNNAATSNNTIRDDPDIITIITQGNVSGSNLGFNISSAAYKVYNQSNLSMSYSHENHSTLTIGLANSSVYYLEKKNVSFRTNGTFRYLIYGWNTSGSYYKNISEEPDEDIYINHTINGNPTSRIMQIQVNGTYWSNSATNLTGHMIFNRTSNNTQSFIEISPLIAVYAYNSTNNNYTNSSSYSVQPNQGILVYSPVNFTWNRSTI